MKFRNSKKKNRGNFVLQKCEPNLALVVISLTGAPQQRKGHLEDPGEQSPSLQEYTLAQANYEATISAFSWGEPQTRQDFTHFLHLEIVYLSCSCLAKTTEKPGQYLLKSQDNTRWNNAQKSVGDGAPKLQISVAHHLKPPSLTPYISN